MGIRHITRFGIQRKIVANMTSESWRSIPHVSYIYEAGVTVVSSYPGTPSTEITEYVTKYNEIYSEWAPNEKVAMETAFGACVAGKRSFCGMKHVGLNVAADPLFTLSYTGVTGGLGFMLAIVLFASVRERVEFAEYPEHFEGFSICLVSAALVALAFMGFSGMSIPI